MGAFRKIAVTVVGGSLLVVGVVLLFLPGPGIAVILAGLAVLASEFAWAERRLERIRAAAKRAFRRGDRNDDATLEDASSRP